MRRTPVIGYFSIKPPEKMQSYIKRDYETLQNLGEVRWFPAYEGAAWKHGMPRGWWPSPRMIRFVRGCDIIVQWFVVPSAPIVAARLCGKPSLAIAGGWDVACVESIAYGRMFEPRTRWMGQLALRLASRVLSVSHFNQSEVCRWTPQVQPAVLHHGIETDCFSQGVAAKERLKQVITVGAVKSDYLARKGMDTFAKVSRLMPDVPFVVAGRIRDDGSEQKLRQLGGDNLQFTGFLADEKLIELMQTSAVYAQLSLHEAFGCSVAEAMLCGCTPVVSSEGALAEVVGDTGIVVPPLDCEAAAKAIRQALDNLKVDQVRARIMREFPVKKRSAALSSVVQEMLQFSN